MRRLLDAHEELKITDQTLGRWNGDRFDILWAVPGHIWKAALPPPYPALRNKMSL